MKYYEMDELAVPLSKIVFEIGRASCRERV